MKYCPISIAIPTRHRFDKYSNFMESLVMSVGFGVYDKYIYLHTILDAPEDFNGKKDATLEWCEWRVKQSDSYVTNFTYTHNTEKKSLAKLWNQCILESRPSWVLICNDDIEFKDGWFEHLQSKIAEGFKAIHLAHFGCFAIHKSLIPIIGWFDEHFTGGGYEDNDYWLRYSEAKQYLGFDFDNMVYADMHFNKDEWDFISHNKTVTFHNGNTTNWNMGNNSFYISNKWLSHYDESCKDYDIMQYDIDWLLDTGTLRKDILHWDRPKYRMLEEIDWHPKATALYASMYGTKVMFNEINNLTKSGKHIKYHFTERK